MRREKQIHHTCEICKHYVKRKQVNLGPAIVTTAAYHVAQKCKRPCVGGEIPYALLGIPHHDENCSACRPVKPFP